ncbi:MAG TPA: tRNA uridine-5-carboxymethylaminomethyl(34) synthesis GTPase MnmE [Kiritimatiellia bacterium]|nr:tRNA uridine-5-carboxymethylaminomethyl(34) synthesis GTPase MnmE [Kiritimatiellia bacterium]HPS06363.1 tRNA uridine-5-carboxymethylaminomethyl(34) synthesis GTPase MnmE [Kiritimatiellia bacterium]
MLPDRTDPPIAAIATAAGAAGVCVVRISGQGAFDVGDRLVPAARLKPSQREAGTFFHAVIVHPASQERIDDAVILVYRAPHSFTGEDTLEIQGHGGSVPSRRLLEAVLAAGARLAGPGEFTKRAFLNGRLDLTQAEAVCDFIQSRTDRAAHVARAQLDGALGQRIGALYERVLAVCADVEHLLDFDEGELPDTFLSLTAGRVERAVLELERLAATWNEGHLLRDGALVVISGRPNAGKSSLLNALLGRDRAIVNAAPGTTRDVIEEGYALNGVPVRLADTAGLRETGDAVEREGIDRARDLMLQADLNVHLVDGSVAADDALRRELDRLPARRTLIGVTKCDLPEAALLPLPGERTLVKLSVKTGAGLVELKAAMARLLGVDMEAQGQPVVALRHVTELQESAAQGRAACTELTSGPKGLVLAARHLRDAAEALGRIVGRVYTDDLLDMIFSRFCVGK